MEVTNLFCACGCGKRLTENRAKVSRYLKGHYHKMVSVTESKAKQLKKELKELKNNKEFMELLKRYNHIDYMLSKYRTRGRKAQKHPVILDRPYSDGCKFCRKYDDNDIKCVMCFENNEKMPTLCPKEK